MTHCLNPDCVAPANPDRHRFCQNCGWRLLLGDRFEAVYPIVEGGNSGTFLGRDRGTLVNPQCLIKRFTPMGNRRHERAAAAERLRQAVDYWAIASQHPQIPDLLALFEREHHIFLVQQFLVGPHLDQVLQEQAGPFDSTDIMAFLQDVLPILHHLHGLRLIHRDIKPVNFRRPPAQPHWWLVDLGVTKPLTATRLAQPGTVVGSADYVSPEQLRGESTFASDIYSLGVVCLHLLTGLPPFDLFDSVAGGWHWRSIVPDVAPELASVLDAMVQPGLRDRPSSVLEVMARLGIPTPETTRSPSVAVAPADLWPGQHTVDLGTQIVNLAVLPPADCLLGLTTAGRVEVRSLQHPEHTPQSLQPHQPLPAVLVAHPHQPRFVLGTRQGLLEEWSRQAAWQGEPLTISAPGITELAFTPDGETLIAGGPQGKITLWHWASKTPKNFALGHAAGITALAVSQDGTVIASGDSTGQVKLWYLPTGECLRTFSRQPGAVSALAWLKDDIALVIASWDLMIRWRHPFTSGSCQGVQGQGFLLPVRSLLTHPSQPWVISGSQDGQLQCWSWAAGYQPLATPVAAIATAQQAPAPIVQIALWPARASSAATVVSVTEAGQLTWRSLPH